VTSFTACLKEGTRVGKRKRRHRIRRSTVREKAFSHAANRKKKIRKGEREKNGG